MKLKEVVGITASNQKVRIAIHYMINMTEPVKAYEFLETNEYNVYKDNEVILINGDKGILTFILR